MKTVILFWLMCCCLAAGALQAGDMVSLHLDTKRLMYQVQLKADGHVVEYDESAFQPPSPGLCPFGTTVCLEIGREGRSEMSYSSSAMSSTMKLTPIQYGMLDPRLSTWSSELYVSTVLTGAEHLLTPKQVAAIMRFKLRFRIALKIDGVEQKCEAESEWLDFPEALRALLQRPRTVTGKSDETQVKLYLVKSPSNLYLVRQSPLMELKLEEAPLFTSAEMVFYNANNHSFLLAPAAYERVTRLQVPVSAVPFVITVGERRVYSGAIWSGVSSASWDGVQITQPLSRAGVELQILPPSPSQPGPRHDPDILQIVKVRLKP